LPPQPPTPLPPDIGGLGARGGKIPAKNKEKWYYTKSLEYRLHIKTGTHAQGRINNQFLITGFSIPLKDALT
jgi:hypothetical protein